MCRLQRVEETAVSVMTTTIAKIGRLILAAISTLFLLGASVRSLFSSARNEIANCPVRDQLREREKEREKEPVPKFSDAHVSRGLLVREKERALSWSLSSSLSSLLPAMPKRPRDKVYWFFNSVEIVAVSQLVSPFDIASDIKNRSLDFVL